MISPNPFKDKLIINGYFSSNNNELTVINLKGNIIYSEIINKGEQKVEVYIPDLKNGIYFVNINNNKCHETYKVVKI